MKDSKKEQPCTLHSVLRIYSMHWWNELAIVTKTQICNTNTELLGGIRKWETLTGREIEKLCAYYE